MPRGPLGRAMQGVRRMARRWRANTLPPCDPTRNARSSSQTRRSNCWSEWLVSARATVGNKYTRRSVWGRTCCAWRGGDACLWVLGSPFARRCFVDRRCRSILGDGGSDLRTSLAMMGSAAAFVARCGEWAQTGPDETARARGRASCPRFFSQASTWARKRSRSRSINLAWILHTRDSDKPSIAPISRIDRSSQ